MSPMIEKVKKKKKTMIGVEPMSTRMIISVVLVNRQEGSIWGHNRTVGSVGSKEPNYIQIDSMVEENKHVTEDKQI